VVVEEEEREQKQSQTYASLIVSLGHPNISPFILCMDSQRQQFTQL
jgi:hypothetical protein